jgi:hypothetical protein
MPWATIEEVEAQTGVTVSAETLALASAMIDTFTGVDESYPDDAISGVDRRHLKKATAWQAVWVAGKPGLITERELATSITSDTQNVQRESTLDAMCAPLAKREITSLSWVGTRTAIVPPLRTAYQNRNFLNESSDPPWFGGEGAIPG